ncbi:MAG: hypothetical protein LBU13_01080, partial [Synergistaceae bacterium]|nr:hypothetical protein [Synergistaceae bacterium]
MTEEASRIKRFDYDNLFKSVLKEYFWDALRIFLPALYNVADKNVPPKFLDNELKKVTFDLEGGANRSDMLAEIKLMDGGNELVLCHLEVQGEGGDDLPTRMMRYRDAIHLHYKKEPVGIAVITAQRPQDEKTFYSSDMFGVTVSYIYVNFF